LEKTQFIAFTNSIRIKRIKARLTLGLAQLYISLERQATGNWGTSWSQSPNDLQFYDASDLCCLPHGNTWSGVEVTSCSDKQARD